MKTSLCSVAIVWSLLALASPAGAQSSQPPAGLPNGVMGGPSASAPLSTPGQPVYVAVPDDANGMQQLPPGAQPIQPAAGYANGGCPGACAGGDGGCGGCGCGGCCGPTWVGFADYLYLRPGNNQVDFAVPRNGAFTDPTVQSGQVGSVDIGYESGYRVGISRQVDTYASIGFTYSQWRGDSTSEVASPTPDYIVHPMITHIPFTNDDATDATAHLSMRFDLADFDYRWKFYCTDRYSMTFVGGARYAHLDQQLFARFNPTVNTVDGAFPAVEDVTSRIEFEGGGVQLGLEAERHSAETGIYVYGHGMASFVAGKARARYNDVTDLFTDFPIDANWKSPRVVSMLDVELGIGWASPGDHIRVGIGYTISAWYNVVKMNDYINSVQANNFVGLGQALTFDGLAAHAEFRY
jgi:hypothetical protein